MGIIILLVLQWFCGLTNRSPAHYSADAMTKAQIKQRMKDILALDSHPAHIAAGFAVGVFISLTPFFGLHTPMAVAAALLFRLNKLTTITGAWVNTPLTVVPVLAASYKLGERLVGAEPREFKLVELSWHALQPYAKAVLLGSAVIGLVAALIAYAGCYWLVVRFRRKDPALASLTKSSVLVGEDLDFELKADRKQADQ